MKKTLISLIILFIFCSSCKKYEEHSAAHFEQFSPEGLAELMAKTISKPLQGQAFVPGKVGGTWNAVMSSDPKSFNYYIAEQDNQTAGTMRRMNDYLIDYDAHKREWVSHAASARIVTNEAEDKLQVFYTLRDDLYWSYYNSDKKVKVTSDDVLFWYNEIEGDEAFNSSGYTGQFLKMPDGSEVRIALDKIDDRTFVFTFPRIIADPLLSTNMDFGPRHIYEEAKKAGGVEGVKNLHSVAIDPKILPSMGEWFLTEYTPGQRLVYKRNKDYWKKDSKGVSIPYIEELVIRIIPEENTQLLLFKDGKTESYGPRPEDYDSIINKSDGSYTVFNSDGALTAQFWTFNQNPVNSKENHYKWFTQKEFRQAMSCLLNRERLNTQVYRGLAQPKLTIFPEPNKYYNPEITLQYLYDTQKAIDLLAGIGIKRDKKGVMRDDNNRKIEFNLTIGSDNSIAQDTASIIRDELSKVGIKVNIRVLDFQKQVQQLFETFDWDSMLIGLSGAGIFPSQGSNVYPSSGNLHLWYPNQKSPATEWEARIDYLYNEGMFSVDTKKAQEIWDEFQAILLEECPMIYLMRPRNFWAINNRWDLTNVYFDNMNGSETTFVYIKD